VRGEEEKLALSLGAGAFMVKPTESEKLWKRTCAIMKSSEARQEMPARLEIVESEEEFLEEYCRIVATKHKSSQIIQATEIIAGCLHPFHSTQGSFPLTIGPPMVILCICTQNHGGRDHESMFPH
jgi:hypothetical protein